MNTFFEKLTSAGVSTATTAEPINLAPARTLKKRAPAKSETIVEEPTEEEPVKIMEPHKLSVETEEAETETAPEEKSEEEEGELTVDIYDKGDSIVIQSTVAGVKPEDLDVSITSDSISIRGRREKTDAVKESSYFFKELFWGTFSRSVILPEEIDEDLAEANLKFGLLTIRLPKKRRGVAQKLKVKVS